MVITLPDVSENVLRIINECKSNSGISGAKLREAHYRLGRELARYINKKEELNKNNSITIFILMRAGLFFGIGISDELESLGFKVNILLSTNNTLKEFDNNDDKIIIVDAVINSGETVINLLQSLNNKEIIVATNVISSSHIDRFDDIKTYATRISEKSYKGSNNKTVSNGKGPDTGDRLFSSNFYE